MTKEERRQRNSKLCEQLRKEKLFERFKEVKETHRQRLRSEGKSADEADDLATELALAVVRAEAAVRATAPASAAQSGPAAPSAADAELARLKAEAAEREAMEAAKQKLLDSAGTSENMKACINWALKHAAAISGGRFPAFDRVKSHPPGPGAVWYLEQSFSNPDRFAGMVAKAQGREADDDDGMVKRERKSIEEVRRLIKEAMAD